MYVDLNETSRKVHVFMKTLRYDGFIDISCNLFRKENITLCVYNKAVNIKIYTYELVMRAKASLWFPNM